MTAGARFRVRLVPRGGIDRIEGVRDGELRVRVAAPPVDGAANEALRRLLAGELGIRAGDVAIVAGASGRQKVVEVAGRGRAAVVARWPGLSV